MSIETEFESTITNVQNAYQGLDNLGATIPQNKTIENIKNCLDEIYNNLPKTDYEEGSNITLSNTLKGKLDFEKIYQQVEYIESTGSAYIDTGIIPNANTKIDIQFETIQRGNFGIIFGGEETYKDNSFHLYNSSGVFDIGFGSIATAFRTSIDYNSSVKYTLIMDKNGFNINGNTGTFPDPTISTTYSIYLFAVHRATNVTETNAQKRIYYCKLYDNGTLVRDMIPCYRKSDGVIGMYDKVQDKFYTNIGTSTFTKGADIGDGFGGERVGIGDTQQTQYEGYNLCEAKMPTTTATQGITFTNNGDGTYTVSGTNSNETSVTFRINQSTQIGGDNLQNYEDGTYTLDLGIADANIGISLMQNVSWTTYLGTGYGTRLVSRAITNATNTFIYVAVKANASFSTPVTIKPMFVKGSYTTSTIPDFEPFVGNSPSPSPSYPQEVKVVRGKNKWGGFTPFSKTMGTLSLTQNKDGSITLNGTASVISSSVTIQEAIDNNIYITLEKGTYTVSGGGNNYVIQIYDTSSNALATISSGQTSVTFTITERKNVICRVFIDSSGTNYNNVNVKVQLEKGSQATSYLPYNTIEVKARGKNKLDFSEWLNTLMDKNPNINAGSIDSYTNNSITITSNGSDCFTASYTISNNAATNKSFCETYPSLVQEVKGNTKYTISFTRSNTNIIARPCFFYLDENYNYLGLDEDRTAADNATFTTPSNAKYLTFRFGLYGSTGSTLTISNLMIEESPSATSYEPYYTPQIKQLSLGEYEFAKIGNYVDTIEYDVDEDKVYKNEYISKVILNGSETIGLNAGVFYLSDITNYAISNNIPYCTHFKGIVNVISGTTSTMANNEIAFRNNIDAYRLYIRIDSISEGNALKTWLSTNKPMLYYALATPTKTEITGTLKDQIKALYNSHSFTGTTIITSNGNLPMIIKVRALKGE